MKNRLLITAGILMGFGMGGFVDGILFHQIMQIHSMLSANLPQDSLVNVKTSMVWDGLFHALTWVTVAIAVAVLWEAAKQREEVWSGVTYWGALLLGWGLFNFVEGIIDHHILQVHHVVERLGLSVYDYLFLLSGLVFAVVGYFLIRKGNREGTESHGAGGSLS